MAWTVPRTWVTNEVVTSALLNTHVRDNESYLYATRVSGYVTSTGTVGYGGRFTSVRNGVGDYTITYSVAFSNIAAPIVTPEGGSGALAAQINGANVNVFSVRFYNAASALTDTAFYFVAVMME